MKLKTENLKLKTIQGFSLVEMLVVVGIFALLSSTIFINFNDFNVRASLDNLAHQVALIVREAQVYGISVSQSSQAVFKGYGAYFSVATPDSQKTFLLFNDKNQNKIYDSSIDSPCAGLDECVEKVSIKTGDMIERIRAGEKTGGSALDLKEVHIVFTRPNPDANILGIQKDTNQQFDKLADVEIYLVSSLGAEKKVVVWSTGQISVE